MGRGEKEREGKPERGKGEGGSASLKSPRAPPPFPGRVVPRITRTFYKIQELINQDIAKENSKTKSTKININLSSIAIILNPLYNYRKADRR